MPTLLASLPTSLPLAGLCVAGSFVFAGVESGLLGLNPARLRARARSGDPAARRLERLLARPERLLAAALLVTNLLDFTALALVTGALVGRLGGWGYLAALGVMLPVWLIVGRVLPKAVFRRFPFRTMALLGGALEMVSWILAPVLAAGSWLSRLFGLGRAFDPLRLSIAREQFAALVTDDRGAAAQVLQPIQREMITAVLSFRRLTAGDLARPLPAPLAPGPSGAVTVGSAAAAPGEIVWAAQAEGVPALLERVVELRLAPDPNEAASRHFPPPVAVSADEPAHRALSRMRAAHRDLALVLRDGQPAGFLTQEGLTAALLGQDGAARKPRPKPA